MFEFNAVAPGEVLKVAENIGQNYQLLECYPRPPDPHAKCCDAVSEKGNV